MEIHDETRTLRRRFAEIERVAPPSRDILGSPAVAGVVVNGGHIPTSLPGQFLLSPIRLGGALVEGGAPDSTTSSGPKFVCTVFGIDVPVAGDMLVARRVGGRWVADTNSGSTSTGGTVELMGCTGVAIPLTLTMVVRDPGTLVAPSYGRFNNCTFSYGTSPWFPTIGPTPTHYSNETFMDTIGAPAPPTPFRYHFYCAGGSFEIDRVYVPLTEPISGNLQSFMFTFRPPPLDGNTETPFLFNSTQLVGGLPAAVLTG